MNESDFNRLKEKSWRGLLTAAEQAEVRAWLALHPEAAADWDADIKLTRAMEQVPNAPVPSNFTARVLQAIERETVPVAHSRAVSWAWRLRSLLPKVAVAAVILTAGLISFVSYEHNETEKRAEALQGVKVVTGVRVLPSPQILQDFDTIRQMGAVAGPDPEVIALMK